MSFDVPYLSDADIEAEANMLLKSFEAKYGTIQTAATPLDEIIENHLGLGFEITDLGHPVITQNAYQHYRNGHLRDAVLNSIIAVFDYIREKTALDEDGDRLIGQAFALDDAFIVLSELETESGKNDQKGFMQIFKGAYQGIRNPKAHSLTHDLTEEKAAQYLIFASLLARRVDEAHFPKKAKPKKQAS